MEQTTNLFELQLDQQSVNYLNESARWARFLSIVGFISCGIMVILGVYYASSLSGMATEMNRESAFAMISERSRSFFYIFFALVMFFPSMYLLSFSSKMRKAVRNNDQQNLTASLKSLKSFFKFYGIFTVIALSFYALAIIAGVIGAVVGHRP